MGWFKRRTQAEAATAARPGGDRATVGSGASGRGNRIVLAVAVVTTVAVLGFALYAGHPADAARNGGKPAGAGQAASGAAASGARASSTSAGAAPVSLAGNPTKAASA